VLVLRVNVLCVLFVVRVQLDSSTYHVIFATLEQDFCGDVAQMFIGH